MKIDLSPIEKQELETRHRKERDGRVRDRIKAVLLHSEGWSQVDIAKVLRVRVETIHTHLEDYRNEKKLLPENGGSESKLDQIQTDELIKHLEEHTYGCVKDICAYILKTYNVSYTVSGMTKWLHHHQFSYKQPKGTPAKADPVLQEEFCKKYEQLLKTTPEDEPIEFGDGVHPTMATKVTCGWIRKGKDKRIETTASRTHLNLFGSFNLETMQVTISHHDTINSLAMNKHFEALRQKYPKAPKIHLILDQGPYNKSAETQKSAKHHGIVLHYLPPYSPNLNPIERLWKVMNEYVRNNRFFRSVKEFKQAIFHFFDETWPQISSSMTSRINDNFHIPKQVSSS